MIIVSLLIIIFCTAYISIVGYKLIKLDELSFKVFIYSMIGAICLGLNIYYICKGIV